MKSHSLDQCQPRKTTSGRIHQLLQRSLPVMVLSMTVMPIVAEPVLRDSVSQYGITWTFDKQYEVGQYCNGDWWVVGPIVLTGPVSDGTNGTMVNPTVPQYLPHGFDYRVDPSYYGQNPSYDPALNKGLNMPLAVTAGSSVISCLSYPEYRSTSQLEHMACLTVVDSPPPDGSFRPTYFGSGNKAATHNKSQIDYTKLQKLPLLPGADLATNEARVARSTFLLGRVYQAHYLVAKYNCPYQSTAYGRELTLGFALVGLELNLNYTDAQKEKMAIGMIQQGLDFYSGIKQGLFFKPSGGNTNGHKLPVAIAGLLLNDSDILARLNPVAYPGIFVEDKMYFYVSQQDIDTPRTGVHPLYPQLGPDPYPQSSLGMPEWGPDGGYPATTAGYNWNRPYRDVCGANSVAVALAARLSGLMPVWGNQVFFDYYDRYYEMEKDQAADSTNKIKLFVKAMWEANRSMEPKVFPAQPTGLKVVE